MRGNCCSCCCSVTALASGSTTWCAMAGILNTIIAQSAMPATAKSARPIACFMAVLPLRSQAARRPSHRNPLAIGRHPSPGAGVVTTLDDALLVDLGDDLAVAGEE